MQVCSHPSASANDKVLVAHEPSSNLDLCNVDIQGTGSTSTPTPTPCDPKEGCIPMIPG